MKIYSFELKNNNFRLNNRYVYYQVLYRLQGISPTNFNSITVSEDTSQKLVFEYNGETYTARKTSVGGAIVVEMPERFDNRYLTFHNVPRLVLSRYHY